MWNTMNQLRRAFWRGFRHGIFMNAKGAAYSSILTVFPALIVVAWLLAETNTTATFIKEITNALGMVLPPGSRNTALAYFDPKQARPLKEIYSASTVMILAASGVMISWMKGFREAHGISVNPWGFWRERGVALLLVVLGFAPMMIAMGLVAFGNEIEAYLVQKVWVPKFYLLLLWSGLRWLIAGATSVTCLMLIYHWGLPRVQAWTKSLPGAVAATLMWFPLTLTFGWYVTNYASYNVIYGPLGAGIALLVWLYLISIVVLVGAEFNALVCPRERIEFERRGEDRRKSDRRAAAR
jgi:membrane protein